MGRLVPMIGGPQDGREHYRFLSTGGSRNERTYYLPGDDSQTGARQGVHVYASQGSVNAPFRYEGVREYRPGDEPDPLNLTPETPDAQR